MRVLLHHGALLRTYILRISFAAAGTSQQMAEKIPLVRYRAAICRRSRNSYRQFFAMSTNLQVLGTRFQSILLGSKSTAVRRVFPRM